MTKERIVRLSKNLFGLPRKGSGNEAFPDWNPPCQRLANSGVAAIRQSGLCPLEEKGRAVRSANGWLTAAKLLYSEFQGFFKSRWNESLYTDSSSKKASYSGLCPLLQQSAKLTARKA